MTTHLQRLIESIETLPLAEKVEAINAVKSALHKISPFATEPVDCVLWFLSETVVANSWNPNSVAPPEMKLLEVSIMEDGYTQPVVGMKTTDGIETVDGFHRGRIGKESEPVRTRVHGYLPVAVINSDREDKADRIAATIRHNRARGKHKVEAMSDIVVELKRRNWSDERISKSLGMDKDEILRLCQITGLSDLFSDQEFSKSWDVEGEITEADFKELSDDVSLYGEEAEKFRTVNTSDRTRVFHTYDKWECYKAGFYATTFGGRTKEESEALYRVLMIDETAFSAALGRIITEWEKSCEHYLTNTSMNRIAWLGQASVCIAHGVSSEGRGGFSLLSESEQQKANEIALIYLNKWLSSHDLKEVSLEEAISSGRQSDIY